MPSAPRSKKMQKVIDSIIGKPENMVMARKTEKEREIDDKLRYEQGKMSK